jgi:hypothetical protein
MNQFNVEHQYQLYLRRMALAESRMHPEQRRQLRQAFFGATGQILLLLRDEAAGLPEEAAIIVMQKMLDQVGEFFMKEAKLNN